MRGGGACLKTRVELEEEKLVGGGVVEVLDGAGSDVANRRGQALRSKLHLPEDFRLGDDRGAFLKDLLEAALGRAIAAVEGHGVAVLISDDLHLEMASVLAELHHEHGGAGHLVLDLDKVGAQLVLIVGHTDTLTTASL